jgi:hypothetical protein
MIAKARKRRRAEGAGDDDGERCSRTAVTVIDTSTNGWKAAKVLIGRGDIWKVRDKKPSATSEHEDALAKGKRRAGLVSKLQRDREKEKLKEKEATSSVSSLSSPAACPLKAYMSSLFDNCCACRNSYFCRNNVACL